MFNQENFPQAGWDLRRFLGVLWLRWRLFGSVVLVVLSLFAALAFLQTPEYTAKAQLRIQPANAAALDLESLLGGAMYDHGAVQGEVELIKSPYMVGRVVDRLNLIEKPEFNPTLAQKSFLAQAKSFLASFITPSAGIGEEEQLHRERLQVIEEVSNRLTVSSALRSNIVNIRFRSQSSWMSAKVANTFADQYLVDQLETRFKAASRTNQWLQKRIKELGDKVRDSERAVQLFKEKHGLLESVDIVLNDQQLSELNSQLIIARAERAQAEARLQQIKERMHGKGGVESVAEVLNSSLIQKLREQETEVRRKEADLAGRYGPKHPRMINVRSELRDVKAKINEEIQKIIHGLENEVEVSRAREQALEDSLNKVQRKVGSSSRAELQLAELVREMEANQALFETFLARQKEVSQVQELDQGNARIISPAQEPIQPSHPRKKLILLAGLMVGLGLGLGFVIIAERLEVGFRDVHQLRERSGFQVLGGLPEAPVGRNPVDYVLQKPMSAYAEAVRSARTALLAACPQREGTKVIGITSTLSGEGKSAFAGSLARLMAGSGSKVLLIDADMRRGTASKSFFAHDLPDNTLEKYLRDESSLSGLIQRDKDTSVDIIAACAGTENSQELLACERMRGLINHLRSEYDLILIDTPPVGVVADGLAMADVVDSIGYLVRWQATPREAVLEGLQRLKASQTPLAGLILSRIDTQKAEGYNLAYGSYYAAGHKYYTN